MFLKLYSAYKSGDVDMQLLTEEVQGGAWILHFWQTAGLASGPLTTLWVERIQTLPYFALINNAAVNVFVGALYNLINMANCPSYDVHSASIVSKSLPLTPHQ